MPLLYVWEQNCIHTVECSLNRKYFAVNDFTNTMCYSPIRQYW